MGVSHSKVVSKLRYAIPLSSFYQLLCFLKIVNDGAFINSCKLEIMICVLCHYVIMNVEVHNVAHGKNIKGLVNYNKDRDTIYLKKHVLELHSTQYLK
jgi:hypothetical protein